MSITDELRSSGVRLSDGNWRKFTTKALAAIADRIDAEHERMFRSLTIDAEPMTDESMAEHGWVRLPVDADGVPICIGDVMENTVHPPTHREVTGVGVECFYAWEDGCGRYSQFDATCYRHYHALTVEDVLLDLLEEHSDPTCDATPSELAEKYAAKLRLAEGVDE